MNIISRRRKCQISEKKIQKQKSQFSKKFSARRYRGGQNKGVARNAPTLHNTTPPTPVFTILHRTLFALRANNGLKR